MARRKKVARRGKEVAWRARRKEVAWSGKVEGGSMEGQGGRR